MNARLSFFNALPLRCLSAARWFADIRVAEDI